MNESAKAGRSRPQAGAKARSARGQTQAKPKSTRKPASSSEESPSRTRRDREVKPRRGEKILSMVAVGILAVGVLGGLAVLPARTWWSQRAAMQDARAQLADIEAEVADLRHQMELLESDSEIERLAKADYGLVYPAEETYIIVDE